MARRPTFDLQSHSTCSDGALAPAAVIAAAHAAGVELLALTDHDTVDGVDEALEAAAARGLGLVAATELSAIDGEREDLHVLGYGIDHRSAALLDALAGFRADRERRAHRMADALREAGLELEFPDRGGAPVGRPHLAQAAFEHPANRMRLEEENLVNFSQLLEAYLIPGRPAYRRRTMPTVSEAIGTIHAAGGVAVWAHPFWDVDAGDEVVRLIDGFAARGPGRRRGVLHHAHRGADAPGRGPLRRARPPHHRLGRLPRPRPSALPRLPRVRPLRDRARSRPDPFRNGLR